MQINFDEVYYEPSIFNYRDGKTLKEKFKNLKWIPINSHNRIPELSSLPNKKFIELKKHLIIGTRKTHKYTENKKVSDWLVPYTSSGCRAMCLYCYLVCNYNKCSYLRIFVNREEMFEKLIKKDNSSIKPETFEIGSNSDLILENTVTNTLPWTIKNFAKKAKGFLTFPTKFDMVEPLLNLNHQQKIIFRMSVNPSEIISKTEFGTSPLKNRIIALNSMANNGYPVGLLIAPVILVENWKTLYSELIDILSNELSEKVKRTGFLEIILMTYSYIHNAINTEAFPNAIPIFNKELMSGKGRGKYAYKLKIRQDAEIFLRNEIQKKLGMKILYIS